MSKCLWQNNRGKSNGHKTKVITMWYKGIFESFSLCSQGRIQRFSLGGGTHDERVEREPITGVWGRSPQRGPGAEPLVGSQGGFAFLKAFWLLNVPQSRKIYPVFCFFLQSVLLVLNYENSFNFNCVRQWHNFTASNSCRPTLQRLSTTKFYTNAIALVGQLPCSVCGYLPT